MARARRPMARALQDQDMSFVLCRTLGHAWEVHKTDNYTGDFSDRTLLSLQCTRCTKIRRDFIRPENAELISRQYVDPKDYELGKGIRDVIENQHILLRQAYRFELVARMAGE